MSILAIDFGSKHLGLAIGLSGGINSPLKPIDYQTELEAFESVKQVCRQYEVNQVVLGLPLRHAQEETQAQRVRQFGKLLETELNLPVSYVDETLTSIDAAEKAVKLGVPKTKRKELKHSLAAVEILERLASKE